MDHAEAVDFEGQMHGASHVHGPHAVAERGQLEQDHHRQIVAQFRCRFAAVENGKGQQGADNHVDCHQQQEQHAAAGSIPIRVGVPDGKDEARSEQRDNHAGQHVERCCAAALFPVTHYFSLRATQKSSFSINADGRRKCKRK
ncbi:hypothetical protein LP420_24505 [Massilia sp. B-10]|nr:hypothetical protein LP420_24505 [Massilia sp. B-10]